MFSVGEYEETAKVILIVGVGSSGADMVQSSFWYAVDMLLFLVIL